MWLTPMDSRLLTTLLQMSERARFERRDVLRMQRRSPRIPAVSVRRFAMRKSLHRGILVKIQRRNDKCGIGPQERTVAGYFERILHRVLQWWDCNTPGIFLVRHVRG